MRCLSKDDNRRELLEKVLREHNHQESALLEILHSAQEIYGYLDKDLLMDISGSLNIPPSHVYGVTTFYSFFKLRKPGEHIVTGCLGTACYVRGVEQIMEAIEDEFNLKRGGSTADGKLSLLITRCIGACAMAPNIVVDDEVIGKATEEIVITRIRSVLGGEKIETS
ncbi:NAD(P)H-dependent oxidoreductase subunit E [Candidatus Bathyarchaeota archaeon]|nr:NAD(P)H-dependent oxidoreductase subunit E [Candidatus Bathyarchaeota archaeon]